MACSSIKRVCLIADNLHFLAQATTVITADQGIRGGKAIELKKMVDEAVAQCPCVKRVFVYQRTGADVPMGPKDIVLDKVIVLFSSSL